MSKKLVIVAIIIIVAGIFIGVMLSRDSRGNEKSDVDIEIEKDGDKNEAPSGTGLEIEEEVDANVDSVDGSGSWEESTDGEVKNEQKESDTEKDNSDETLDGEVLEDDKEWGDIS